MARLTQLGLLFVLSIAGGSCSKTEFNLHPTPETVVGIYEFHPFGHETLTIKEDHTFQFERTNDLLEVRVTDGQWKIDGNSLIKLIFESDGHTTHYR
tara:strand:- start:113 stop:403 length:291 start_codon:yes stop_codon:yes gene_type:complete